MTLQLIRVSRPATAVMFLIARMLGGPGQELGGRGRGGAMARLARDGRALPRDALLSRLDSETLRG